MNKRLLMSAAATMIIASGGVAYAQGAGPQGGGAQGGGAGMSREAPAARSPAGSGPGGMSADRAAPAANNAATKRDEATDTTNKTDQDPAKQVTQSDDKVKRDDGNQRATDTTRDNGRTGKDMKAEGRDNSPADSKSASDNKSMTDSRSTTTTGQAGAGAKMTTEQRTKVTTVIKQQNVKPVTNVNFSISIGTRVPRDVEFHPLPTEIVTIYPDWRGYDFILVSGQIIVINPRSYEIVAIIDA